MSAPIPSSRNDSARDPWEPPEDAVWFDNPLSRARYFDALQRHNARLFADALEFLALWKDELIAEDAA